MQRLKNWLRQKGIRKSTLRWWLLRRVASSWFLSLYCTDEQRKKLLASLDPVRYGTFLLAFEGITKGKIEGSLAECGVYKGALSKVLHEAFPDRKLFLFDTFSGFDHRDSDTGGDARFADTSEQSVVNHIGGNQNVIVRKGFFPETAAGLDGERFALVVFDFDKYEPTMAALKLFYPLVNRGGFIFVHDYSNPESNWACSRAFDEFLRDKPEMPILIPDAWGTAIIRKL